MDYKTIRYIISCGDPYGVSGEIIKKSLNFITKGRDKIIFVEIKMLSKKMRFVCLFMIKVKINTFLLLMLEIEKRFDSQYRGKECAYGGEVSFKSFTTALECIQKKDADVLITLPVSKKSWVLSGSYYAGHTDYFQKNGFDNIIMGFWSDKIVVMLLTHHIPLRDVPLAVTSENLNHVIESTHRFFFSLKHFFPKIAVAGLNPHASDNGLMGQEEQEKIEPVIESLKRKGILVEGPFSPDVLFAPHVRKKYDVIIALYHDQGLIPFKMLAFEKGIQISLNLPFLRVSPDHGLLLILWGKIKRRL